MYNTPEYVYLDEYITQVGQGGKAIHRKVIQDCLEIPPLPFFISFGYTTDVKVTKLLGTQSPQYLCERP